MQDESVCEFDFITEMISCMIYVPNNDQVWICYGNVIRCITSKVNLFPSLSPSPFLPSSSSLFFNIFLFHCPFSSSFIIITRNWILVLSLSLSLYLPSPPLPPFLPLPCSPSFPLLPSVFFFLSLSLLFFLFF